MLRYFVLSQLSVPPEAENFIALPPLLASKELPSGTILIVYPIVLLPSGAIFARPKRIPIVANKLLHTAGTLTLSALDPLKSLLITVIWLFTL